MADNARDGLHPVVTAAEMQAFEARCFGLPDVSERVVMESAGRSVAEAVLRHAPEGAVAVAVGSGNNGGDGVVAARTLQAAGREVRLVNVGRGFDAGLLHGWSPAVRDLSPNIFDDATVIIDALLGTGASGAPRGAFGDAVRAINAASGFVVAVDGPTGVDLTTGAAEGDAIRADLTVTFGNLKLGHLLYPGRERAGRLLLAEVGFPPFEDGEYSATLITDRWAAANLPSVPPDAHKGTAGIVGVVAGSRGMAGAAVMASMGALRAGAGGVRVISDEANRVILQSTVPEAIFHERSADTVRDLIDGLDAVVIGPGMGTDDSAGDVVAHVLQAGLPTVIDADALTLIAGWGRTADALPRAVMTPHPGELGRLANVGTEEALRRRLEIAGEMAERYGSTLLAKGAPSFVVRPGRPALITAAGHSGIATGGVGDTLSGICGALLARGLEPDMAAILALHYSGRAAEIAGRGRGLLPRDIAEALPDALAALGEAPPEPPFLLDVAAPR